MASRRLHDSVKDLQNFWWVLAGMKKVKSWEELFADVLRGEHHLAFRRKDLVKETVRRLLDMLLDPGCDNLEAASRIIQTYCRITNYLPKPTYQEWYPFEYAMDLLDLDGKVLKKHKPHKYWTELDCEIQRMREDRPTVYTAFRNGDEQLMRVLVTYGLALRPEVFGKKYYVWDWYSIIPHICAEFRQRGYPFRIASVTANLENLQRNGGHMTSQNRRGFRRIPHIIRSLEAARLTVEDLAEERGKAYACMQLQLFDTLPDPLVTVEEAREFLLYSTGLEADTGVQRRQTEEYPVVLAFVRLFGDRDSFEPRSLSHLCRCKVRDTLVQNVSLTLPYAIARLPIPNTLKDFLLCSSCWSSFQDLEVPDTEKNLCQSESVLCDETTNLFSELLSHVLRVWSRLQKLRNSKKQ